MSDLMKALEGMKGVKKGSELLLYENQLRFPNKLDSNTTHVTVFVLLHTGRGKNRRYLEHYPTIADFGAIGEKVGSVYLHGSESHAPQVRKFYCEIGDILILNNN